MRKVKAGEEKNEQNSLLAVQAALIGISDLFTDCLSELFTWVASGIGEPCAL